MLKILNVGNLVFMLTSSFKFIENGLVYVCGESESGKLGIDINFSTQIVPKQMQLPNPVIHVACGGHHTVILTGIIF